VPSATYCVFHQYYLIFLSNILIFSVSQSLPFGLCLYFLLSLTSVYLLIVDIEGYCAPGHTQIHTYSVGLSGRGIGQSQRPLPVQHTTFTKDKHPRPCSGFEHAIRASEPPQTYASDRAPTRFKSLPHYLQIDKPEFAEDPPLRVKDKENPLQAWTGPEGSRRLTLPDFKTSGT
jgi:hypothetical protein